MWRVIVPVKGWALAKSRLELPAGFRRQLAEAMAADTLAAVTACPSVSDVVVLASDASLIGEVALAASDQVLIQPPSLSLSEAVTWAVTEAAPPGPQATAVVMADLPALRPFELQGALAAAARVESSMVVDRHGTGTTALMVTGPTRLVVQLGSESAARHRRLGVHSLTDDLGEGEAAGLRCDVDTVADLVAARALGLGEKTRSVERSLGSPS